MTPAAKQAAETKEKMQQLQARAMRFADEYVGRVVEDSVRFGRQFDDPEFRLLVSGWTLAQANSAYTNAAGPSPVVNVLDLVTLATLSRMVIEDTVVPKFPEQSKYLLETHRALEAKAWTMCSEFLTPSQIAEFHDVLDEWRRQHPRLGSSVALIHFLDFAKQIGRPKPGEEARSGGLFAMLGIDPLAGLDPAVQQIEQTRQLAERTIYYMQRLPYIVNLQIDRVSNDTLSRPETRGLLRNAETISDALKRYADVAVALPGQITAEREALIRQLSGEMLNQQESLRPLLVDLRSTLDAGSQTAQSVDAAIRSVDQLMARFPQKPPGSGAAAEPGKPFDITEYSAAAAEFARTASELRQLVATLDAQGPALSGTVDAAVSRSKSLVNFLFLRAAALIVLLVGAVLGAALIYRRVVRAPARGGQAA